MTFTADKAVLVPGEPKWANYVKGVVSEYLKDVPPGRFFGCFVCVCVCVYLCLFIQLSIILVQASFVLTHLYPHTHTHS